MNQSVTATIVRSYHQTLARILGVAERLSAEMLITPPQPGAHPIAFEVWHVARWADHLQAALPGMTEALGQRIGPRQEVWHAQELAARWGFDPARLSYAETGMGMHNEAAHELRWPDKSALLDYTKTVFALAEQATSAIDDEQFLAAEQPQPLTDGIWVAESTVGGALVVHLTHTNRHLGMIECLCGLQTGSGTATV